MAIRSLSIEAAAQHGLVDAVHAHLLLRVAHDVHPLDAMLDPNDATNLDRVDHLTCPLRDLRAIIARTVDPMLEAYLRGVLQARAQLQLRQLRTETLGHPARWFIE
jgi:hypothetical protein